jgi:hypothetical protein
MSDNDTIVQHALELVDSCWNTYASTAYVVHNSSDSQTGRLTLD